MRACEGLNLKPSECIRIEDSQFGIKSIDKSGMFSIEVGEVDSMNESNYYMPNTKDLSLNNC